MVVQIVACEQVPYIYNVEYYGHTCYTQAAVAIVHISFIT